MQLKCIKNTQQTLPQLLLLLGRMLVLKALNIPTFHGTNDTFAGKAGLNSCHPAGVVGPSVIGLKHIGKMRVVRGDAG